MNKRRHPRQVMVTDLTILTVFCVQCSPSTSIDQRNSDASSNWKRIGPGGGGATFTPIFSQQSPDHFIVRCDMTGTYITTDGGDSYYQFNFANGTSSYAFDHEDLQTIYAANNALFRSHDGGMTWQQLFPKPEDIQEARYLGDHANYRLIPKEGVVYPPDASHISNISIDPSDNRRLYFNMGRYFFYSSDSGESWKRIETPSSIKIWTLPLPRSSTLPKSPTGTRIKEQTGRRKSIALPP